MSASGAPEAAGGAPGPSEAGGGSTLDPEQRAAPSNSLPHLDECAADALLRVLLREDDPRYAGLKRALDDEDACDTALSALKELVLVSPDRWGADVAVSRLGIDPG